MSQVLQTHFRRCDWSAFGMSLAFRRRTRFLILVILAVTATALYYLLPKHNGNSPIISQIYPSNMDDNIISLEEVSKHKSADSAWVVIEGKVYDVTEFLEDHPGGKKVLLENCGKDSTELFQEYHTKQILRDVGGPMMIGQILEDSKL